MKQVALCEPNLIGKEKEYLIDCIESNWVSSSGKYVDKFQESVCSYTGIPYSSALSSGTSALHLALIISGVRQDEEVLVPSLTFIAPVNTIRYVGASPVFLDCDESHSLDVSKTIEFIEKETYVSKGRCFNKKSNKVIAALIPVHIWGNIVQVSRLVDICKERKIKIIEDCSESLGSFYPNKKGKLVHTGSLSDFSCLSFNGNKIITSGGGGMLLSSKKKEAELAKYLSTQSKDDPFQYIHKEIGFNYRLTNIQAAVGLAQIEKIDYFLTLKKEIYNNYVKQFSDIDNVELVSCTESGLSNHWMNVIRLNMTKNASTRDRVIKALIKNNIECRPVWFPNHLQKPYKSFQAYKVTRAKKEVNSCVCLPSSSSLKEKEISKIVKVIKEALVKKR